MLSAGELISMFTHKLTFGMGLFRFLLAAAGMWLFPLLFPPMAAHRWIFAAYAGVAIVEQAMIWRDLGGEWRALIGGVLDVAIFTFIIQRTGTSRTILVSLYFVAVIVNAMLVTPRMGFFLSMLAGGMYTGVVLLERAGKLPYAPDSVPWVREHPPEASQALAQALGLLLLLLFTALVVATLVHRVNQREQQLVEANARLAELSRKDPLTKLWNRRHILSCIEDGLAWLNRGRPMAVVMLDLDGFKRVNDLRGHLEGDQLLRDVADALQRSIREIDVAGRYGGDEFVVVLPDANQEEGRIAANRIVAAIREVGLKFDARAPVTASAGLSIGRPGDSPASVLKRADDYAYSAKSAGGNRLSG